MDRKIDAGSDDPSRGRAEETAAVRQLIEALTALGNYLETAKQVSTAESDAARKTLTRALARSTEQFERAVGATRRLRDLIRLTGQGDP